MSYADEQYEQQFVVAEQSEATRVAFLRKVYGHVFACILGLCAVVGIMRVTDLDIQFLQLVSGIPYGGLVFIVGFMGASWIAQKMAYSQTSRSTQYLGLGLYTVAWGVMISPLIVVATVFLGDSAIVAQAGVLTLTIFGGLTAVVFFTKADFSFLRGIVVVGSFAAMGIILVSFIPGLGISTGLWFSVAMVALMSITILWETSEIYHRFPESAYVAAALALFSSVATLFFYVLRILIAMRD